MTRNRSFQGTSNDYWGLAFISIGSIILLLIGWIIGAILVAKSKSWSKRDKWIALCLPPGGYAFVVLWIAVLLSGPVGDQTCLMSDPPICTQLSGVETVEQNLTYAFLALPLLSTAFLTFKLWQPRDKSGELASSEAIS